MAVKYLRSTDGSDASDGNSWANAYATLEYAMAALSAGDTLYVSKSHAETQAGNMFTINEGTAAAPVRVLCVDDTGDPEPPTALSTGATFNCTYNGNNSFHGFYYIYGIDIAFTKLLWCGCGAPTSGVFENCILRVGSVGWYAGTDNYQGEVLMQNCTIDLATYGMYLQNESALIFRGCTFSSDGYFAHNVKGGARLVFEDCDLSAITSAFVVDSISSTADGGLWVEMRNCKTHANLVSFFEGFGSDWSYFTAGGSAMCCGADMHDFFYGNRLGVVCNEDTIVRTGGATDGVTNFSWKMATNASALEYSLLFLETPPITLWNTVTTEQTLTLHCIVDSATNLQDDEVWLDISYPAHASTMARTRTLTKASVLATKADLTASTETWTTTGMTNPNEFKLSVTLTAARVGNIVAKIGLAKASTTVYVCPKVEVS